jgi:recombination protein RecA
MSLAALDELLRSAHLRRIGPQPLPPAWGLDGIGGRLVELSAVGASAVLTVATGLVLEAQRAGEPVAWITGGSLFFPPDLAESGVDLESLVVIQVPPRLTEIPAASSRSAEGARTGILRAADRLLRSGAFGLVVLDLERTAQLPLAAQSRLAGLAQRHDTAVLCLTAKQTTAPSLGSLVSLHASATRRPATDTAGRFCCEVRVTKDKRRGPGWIHREEGFRGPPGLR